MFNKPMREEDVFNKPMREEDMFNKPMMEEVVFNMPMMEEDVSNKAMREEDVFNNALRKETHKRFGHWLKLMGNTIKRVAPESIFDKNRSCQLKKRRQARRVANIVPTELQSLWHNSQVTCVNVPDPYPIVKLANVNKRFLSNCPDPKAFPIHGCSDSPKFYEWEVSGFNNQLPPPHHRPNPFGFKYGYLTDVGVISVPTDVIHGYVWSEEHSGWLLKGEKKKGDQGEQRRGGHRSRRQGERRRKMIT